MASQAEIGADTGRTFPRSSEFMVRGFSVAQMLQIKTVWSAMTADDVSELGFDPTVYGIVREESVPSPLAEDQSCPQRPAAEVLSFPDGCRFPPNGGR